MGKEEAVKLIRSPIDTNCVDCSAKVPFGIWVYYEPASGNAVCIECGTKKGWMPKDRANQLIQKLELQEDIKALRKQRKIETEALLLVRREIDLGEVVKKDHELEGEIVTLMRRVEDYLRASGDKEEEKKLKAVFDEIEKARKLQRAIRALTKDRLLFLERRKRKADLESTLQEIEEHGES